MLIKKIIFILISVLIIPLIISCAGTSQAVEYSYQYLGKQRKDSYTEIFKYRYKIENGDWQNIDIYVKNENFTYIINMETYFGQERNSFIYNSLKKTQNFTSKLRLEPETVNSLQEAVELALGMYIQDVKSKEKPQG